MMSQVVMYCIKEVLMYVMVGFAAKALICKRIIWLWVFVIRPNKLTFISETHSNTQNNTERSLLGEKTTNQTIKGWHSAFSLFHLHQLNIWLSETTDDPSGLKGKQPDYHTSSDLLFKCSKHGVTHRDCSFDKQSKINLPLENDIKCCKGMLSVMPLFILFFSCLPFLIFLKEKSVLYTVQVWTYWIHSV